MPLTAAAASYETQVNINIAENDKKMMGLILTVLADSIRSQDMYKPLDIRICTRAHLACCTFLPREGGPCDGPKLARHSQEDDEFRDQTQEDDEFRE